jgi:regulator of protease activity HflC (stomatin/prohibitin superfamily)
MNPRTLNRIVTGVVALVALYAIGYVGIWQWGICRIEVPAGKSLRLQYRGPFPFGGVKATPEGTLVKLRDGRPQMLGILEDMPGPGRHFYSPLEYEWKLVDDIVVAPGKIGIVTSKVGQPLPSGSILADGPGFRGTWRKVLTPGRYRFNDYAYKVEVVPMSQCVGAAAGLRRREDDIALIPPGYVGVVTNKADNPETKETQGIQENVLQPGLYFINPYEKQVDIVSLGFNETTLMAEAAAGSGRGDRLGKANAKDPEFLPGKGIEFPSNDGFTIHMDYTAIWGILPDQAPDVVRQFGTLKDVEQKVILPQIGSICRLHGSKRSSVDLLVGDKREEFQTDTAEELEKILESKKLTLLFGLTRHIYVPSQVREPIQKKYIADELKLTADQRQLTLKAQAELTEAKAKVTLEERRTKAETLKLVAELTAEGEKKARQIEAETEKLKAEIDAKTAQIQAQITTTLGEATAKKTELANEAEAERYKLYVNALGSPEAYNKYIFADKLPADLKLGVFYAGPGTFWTDLKGFEQTMLGKLASESVTPKGGNDGATAGR